MIEGLVWATFGLVFVGCVVEIFVNALDGLFGDVL